MPVPSFLSSIADKIQASPLANRLQQSGSEQPSSSRSVTHNIAATLNHQFRTLQQQYGNVSPSQKMITSSKGVSMDCSSLSNDLKSSSKELYMWGQTEAEDIKDVSDRLAYFNYVHGSLSNTLSVKLDSARGPLKALRNADSGLASRRNIRAGYDREISKLEADRPRGYEKRIAELEQLLRNAEIDDDPLEKEVEILSRNALRASEQLKWAALREYAERLIILSHAATQVIDVLPSVPPSLTDRYSGAETTAAVRAAVQHALDNYKLGDVDFPLTNGSVDLSRADTRSFGETHAKELSSIGSSTSNLPHIDENPSPEPTYKPSAISPSHSRSTSVLEYSNQAPVQLPIHTDNTSHAIASPDSKGSGTISAVTPTVAETALPQSGLGPSGGGLDDSRSPSVSSSSPSGYGVGIGAASTSLGASAEEEKKRLAREGSTSTSHHFESAEEEKKRLEREERERLLSGRSSADHADEEESPSEELPPYNEF